MSKKHEAPSSDAQAFVRLSELPPSALLPNTSSVQFNAKKYRGELVAAGALIPGKGRAGSLAHRELFPAKIIEIRKREAQGTPTGA